MSSRVVKVLRAGRLKYTSGLKLQESLLRKHRMKSSTNEICNTLILIEHEPVYTVGIRDKSYTKEEETKLKSLGAEFHRTNRGGLITFHGPGQLVVYPVLDLRDFKPSMRWYVCQIEKMVIRLCAEFGIRAQTTTDTGVWVGDRKICAIGVHGSRYITSHGLALNCNTDLKWYDHIVPCGIEGKGVTSLSNELDMNVTVETAIPLVESAFRDEFECSLIEYPQDEASDLLWNVVPEDLSNCSRTTKIV